MSPKDKLEFYDELANKLKAVSADRMKKVFTAYGFPFSDIDSTLNKHEFALQVLESITPEEVVSLATDYNVDIPVGYLEAKQTTIRNMPGQKIQSSDGAKRIFISHSSLDKDVVGKLIAYIRAMGVSHTSIFCSSFRGYGVPLGTDFLEKIKTEINGDTIVLFVLSPNFYNSPVSLCEMGAAWINAKEHVPILIPPFEFEDVKGVFPHSIGMKINEKEGLNELKDKIDAFLNLRPINFSIWERDRNAIHEEIEKIISERSKPNAKVISYYNKLSSELSEEDMKILTALNSKNGEAVGMFEYLTQTDYGEDIIRNLERLNLVERSDDPDMHDFYHLSLFGLNMMFYLDKQAKSKVNNVKPGQDIRKALSYFATSDNLDKDEFDPTVWQKEVGPAIVLLEKNGMAKGFYANEEDYPIAGDLTLEGKEEKSRLQ